MTRTSALISGSLVHTRRDHLARRTFRYPVYMASIDLDELPALDRELRLFSHRGKNVFALHDADYEDGARGLRAALGDLLAANALPAPATTRLVTNLRAFGYVFNPVSFYYCFDAADRAVEAVVAEVNNTPWGERHCYVLQQDTPGACELRARSAKAMHVSPFQPMALRYDWRLHTPAEALQVHMTLRSAEPGAAAPIFGATLALRRVPITGASLAGTLLRFPWMTAKVIVAIHWQALRLWLKRIPVYRHPVRSLAARVAAPVRTHTTEHPR